MLLDAILEEAAGTLCGLPPGTVTAAKAMGVGLAATSASDEESSQVQRRTSQLSREERKAVELAVHNVAVTAGRDNPGWTREECARFAMGVVLVANRLYDGDDFKAAMLDAMSASRRRHHRLIKNVTSAVA